MITRKRILIDLLRLRFPNTGLGQVCMAYGRALARINHPAMQFTFLVPSEMTGIFGNTVDYITARPIKDLFCHYRLSGQFDLWHSTHQDVQYYPNKQVIYVLTIHDLNFIREKSERKIKQRTKNLYSLVQRANAVVAISNFTKRDMKAHLALHTPVEVIYNGVDKPSENTGERPAWAFADGEYFFAIGVFKPNKNYQSLVRLIYAYPGTQLIIAGTNDTAYGKMIRDMIRDYGLQQRILTPGVVNETEKAWLYAHCRALLFPSTNEGMGLPIIEAMHRGKPVVASAMSCMPEFGGDYAYYFPSFDPTVMRATIEESLMHYHRHPEQILAMQHYAAQFSWDKHAEEYVKLFERLLNGEARGTLVVGTE